MRYRAFIENWNFQNNILFYEFFFWAFGIVFFVVVYYCLLNFFKTLLWFVLVKGDTRLETLKPPRLNVPFSRIKTKYENFLDKLEVVFNMNASDRNDVQIILKTNNFITFPGLNWGSIFQIFDWNGQNSAKCAYYCIEKSKRACKNRMTFNRAPLRLICYLWNPQVKNYINWVNRIFSFRTLFEYFVNDDYLIWNLITPLRFVLVFSEFLCGLLKKTDLYSIRNFKTATVRTHWK